MSDEMDEKEPMINTAEDSPPEPTTYRSEEKETESPPDPASTTQADPPAQADPPSKAATPDIPEEANHVADAPPSPSTSVGDKPIKPPRLKSMRSKEGSPMIKKTHAPDDSPDIEAATLPVTSDKAPLTAPAGDDAEQSDRQPYQPTTAKKDAVKPKKSIGDHLLGNKWIILGIIAVVLIILIILIVAVSVSRPRKMPPTKAPVYADPVVRGLKCGEMEGLWERNHTVAVFKGIPYSKPPVGDNRWTYNLGISGADDCNNVSEKAKEFRGPCFQLKSSPGVKSEYLGTEDCLYLNVWTPATPGQGSLQREKGAQLPVLVYIHGGFLHYGSGHEEGITPRAELASELNAVIVSFNYRLNVFGWMAVENLAPGNAMLSGNFGLYDQINALKWVKDYIEQFGGNPNLVTLSGLSSGGTSVLALLTNPQARQTFQRVWISGASSKFDGDRKDTYSANENVYLRNVGCKDKGETTRQCMLSKTSKELVDAIPWIQYPSWAAMDLVDLPSKDAFIGGVLINDERLINKAPNLYLKEDAKDLNISILIGNDEYESDMYQVVDVSSWTWGQYADYLRSKLDTFPDVNSSHILSLHPELRSNPRLHMSRIVSDLRSICPQTFTADLLVNSTQSLVYRYVNSVKLPKKFVDKYQAGSEVATHGSEVALLFFPTQDADEKLKTAKKRFRQVLQQFMKNGEIDKWNHFPAVYKFNNDSVDETSLWTSEACDKWRSFYPAYSWMN